MALNGVFSTVKVSMAFFSIAITLQPSNCASLVPALFIFGDSSADTGNNKFLEASKDTANFLPYGRDLVPPRATGRFSNGKLSADYLAEFLNLPYPINFYDPEANDQKLLQGVNFASAGSGILDQTGNISGSISLSQQLQNCVLVQKNISQLIGPVNTSELMESSIFVISSGNNDLIDYQTINANKQINDKEDFNSVLISKIVKFVQMLYSMGARKIMVISPCPLGCAPIALTIFNSTDGNCIQGMNSQVKDFNSGLLSNILMLPSQLPEAKVVFGNIYNPMLAVIQDPTESGFEYAHKACCGDGIYGGSSICTTSTLVCANASQYIFWDWIHPTQALYKILTDDLLYGPQSIVSPFNMSQLVLL